jgi:GNAT superfamily N-acetyltransferase
VRADVRIRAATPADCDELREITVASKASWGYPGEVMDGWADSLHISAELLDATDTVVAEAQGGRTVGWAQLVPPVAGVAVLDHLWIRPESMRAGIGTRLFRWAAARAREQGAATMEWESDPNAVGFYRRMGGHTVRTQRSEWGRDLPVMAVDLHRDPGGSLQASCQV